MNDINKAVEIFEKYGIATSVNKDNLIVISHYCQPKESTFKELGIDEDELIKNVVACSGVFDTRNSSLTTFPLIASQEIRLDKETNIPEMPNLKAVGRLLTNSKLKKLPKLKAVGSILMENVNINSLPKLKEAGIIIAQNSSLKELGVLKKIGKLCIIDCPLTNLKELESAQDIFICSSDEDKKIELSNLGSLKEVKQLFIANCELKQLSNLKKAEKIALYNCKIKSIKQNVCKNVEIGSQIKDEILSEKFDTFTDWYNSDILEQSMNLLGNIVKQIKE